MKHLEKHQQKNKNLEQFEKNIKNHQKTIKNRQRPSETFKNDKKNIKNLHVITCQETWKGAWSGSCMKTSQDDHSIYHANPLGICYILLWHDVSKMCRYIFHQDIPSTRFWKIFYLFFVFSYFCVFSIFLQPRVQNWLKMTLRGNRKRVKTGVLNIFQLFFYSF